MTARWNSSSPDDLRRGRASRSSWPSVSASKIGRAVSKSPQRHDRHGHRARMQPRCRPRSTVQPVGVGAAEAAEQHGDRQVRASASSRPGLVGVGARRRRRSRAPYRRSSSRGHASSRTSSSRVRTTSAARWPVSHGPARRARRQPPAGRAGERPRRRSWRGTARRPGRSQSTVPGNRSTATEHQHAEDGVGDRRRAQPVQVTGDRGQRRGQPEGEQPGGDHPRGERASAPTARACAAVVGTTYSGTPTASRTTDSDARATRRHAGHRVPRRRVVARRALLQHEQRPASPPARRRRPPSQNQAAAFASEPSAVKSSSKCSLVDVHQRRDEGQHDEHEDRQDRHAGLWPRPGRAATARPARSPAA